MVLPPVFWRVDVTFALCFPVITNRSMCSNAIKLYAVSIKHLAVFEVCTLLKAHNDVRTNKIALTKKHIIGSFYF